MIVKDEAHHIAQSLESVQALVDEMIVLDTGSRDGTQTIARRMGARLFEYPWEDDFSKARNRSLMHARGEWILVLDADEMISASDHENIRALLGREACFGFALEQRTYGNNPNFRNWVRTRGTHAEERGYGGYIPSSLIRLFRSDPRIRFTGPVHELVESSFGAHALPFERTHIPIHHYGKVCGPSKLKEKAHLYVKLGKLKTAKEPADTKVLNDLGTQYLEIEAYEEAIDIFQEVVKRRPQDPEPLADLGVAFLRKGCLEDAAAVLVKALDLDPHDTVAVYNLATVYLHKKRYGPAEKLLRHLVALQPDAGIAYGALASIMLCRNRIDEGITLLLKAISCNPKDADLYSNLAWAHIQLGQRAQAIASCRKALSLNPDQKNASRLMARAQNMPPLPPHRKTPESTSARKAPGI